jgi:hypothetical protein
MLDTNICIYTYIYVYIGKDTEKNRAKNKKIRAMNKINKKIEELNKKDEKNSENNDISDKIENLSHDDEDMKSNAREPGSGSGVNVDFLYPFSYAFFRTSLCVLCTHIESRFCNPHVVILLK